MQLSFPRIPGKRRLISKPVEDFGGKIESKISLWQNLFIKVFQPKFTAFDFATYYVKILIFFYYEK